MQFLKTLFWVVVGVIAAIFAYRNWTPVPVTLWGGLIADVKLPVLMVTSFVVGFLPPFIIHRTTRWRMRRRLEGVQRELEEARAAAYRPAPVATGDANVDALPAPDGPAPLPLMPR